MSTDEVHAHNPGRRIGETVLSVENISLAFGGVKASGFGRLNGRAGLHGMCNVKAVVEDRLPLHQPTRLFPVGPGDYGTYGAAIQTLYRPGVVGKLRAAAALVGAWWKG